MARKRKTDQGSSAARARALTEAGARVGLVVFFGSDPPRKTEPSKKLSKTDDSPIARAIRAKWPDAHPVYQADIRRRFTESYTIPEAEILHAIHQGFSSPATAMRAGAIKRRRYRGFRGDRT
jgi:hypothetical protein